MVKMPQAIWDANKGKEIWYDHYCGFVWSTSLDERATKIVKRSIGHFRADFVPNGNYRMKPEPKPKRSRR